MASIKKRGNNWQVRVSYKDETGKFRTKSQAGFKTKREAQLFANEYEIKADNGELKSKRPPLFADYFWEWYETYKESSIRNRTVGTYVYAHKVLKQFLPNARIDEMDRRAYQKFIKDFGKHRAKSTVAKLNSLYHASVKDAVYDGVIQKDFIEKSVLVYDKDKTWDIEYLSEKETKQLVDYLMKTRNPHYTSKYMIITALFTGMRPGEIGGLTWENINKNFNTISVNQSWSESAKDFEDLKNDASQRTIRTDKWLLDLISELPHEDKQYRVFANQFKTIPTSNAVNKVLRAAMKELGINRKGFHFHSCRHTHVAYLLSHGVDLYAISKRLGHSDITVTSRVYSYLIDEYKQKTDDKIITALSDLKPENFSNDFAQTLHKAR
ncbi:site-specific integrase [Loigolactobacillus coryniformis]|uniref:Site-specific integrase n=2 Tax=Loigolactobacillus coryniformis TaxID=1610 RepID=A0A2D1KMD1_9LACO|nr:site-specific integrase [Loigolactobacillus coryniformis]ATO43294.1 site-specific integrase [Loigolactobacillus coryniformis subsp. torquens DSM 20004 = KCTC 3535]KRK85612.1 Phage integrase [Loigolactobacillus coryniformis subsp. torquens DSM 20004 = KCTC 3535]